jgi:sarcosine oxidase subunit alpha
LTGSFRRPGGGRIDRSRTVTITFDGVEYLAHPGDTLASALLSHGVRTLARGPYTGRPRGLHSAGPEEPSAFVQVESGVGEPMVAATRIEVYDGLRASALPGKGRLLSAPDTGPDTSRYDKTYAHCDVLVVGAGPAGLAAAQAAARGGARVIIADEQPELGGSLLTHPGPAGLAEATAEATAVLAAAPEVTVLTRTTVTGYYDHDFLVAVQRRTDHLGGRAPSWMARHRLWRIRARRVVLATGALERPILFAGNDRPGIMLAGAAAAYAHRYGVLAGRRAVVFGAHDGALAAALDLLDAGVELAGVLDAREAVEGELGRRLSARGVQVLTGHGVAGTEGAADGVLTAALVAPLSGPGGTRRVECDLLAVSGGWNPNVHLFSQSGGRTRWSDEAAAFVPEGTGRGTAVCAGAARGTRALEDAVAEGTRAGAEAARACGFTADTEPSPAWAAAAAAPVTGSPPAAFWLVEPAAEASGEVFADLQRDATLQDVRRAVGAGLTSSEHVKRYTTIGTAADQGRTSGVTTVGLLGRLLGRPMDEIGTTTYRPPYAPLSFALLAGRDRGDLLEPVRRTPMHEWHRAHGALFEDVGQWKRPWYYPHPGETMEQAVLRECHAAREDVAVLDASTLGKIDIQGSDAAEFLDRIYTNKFSSLAVGRCRYGVMCTADGMIFDDGVTARLGPERFHLTTTTGNAAAVLDWMEDWLQTEWPDLRVRCTSVTDQWATVAVVGPRSRDVLAGLDPGLDCGDFPFMAVRDATVAGVPARVFRISFTGELSYEINVPAWHGLAVWEAVMAAGQPYGITPYGTETMHVLRAEKGFIVVGQETDGTVTPPDAGLSWAVSKAKSFVGKRSLRRADTVRADRKGLVGLRPADGSVRLTEGAQLVAGPPPADVTPDAPVPMLGHITSAYRGTVGSFALALVSGGMDREGETLYAVHDGGAVPVLVTDPVFYDKEGARRDGDAS